MIAIPSNVRVWLATGHTDMRRGFPSLALLVQESLKRDPHLCVGRGYVAARPQSGQFRGDGEICRHIIFKCFPEAAALSPWVDIALAACLIHLPYPARGASSRRRRRHSDVWWRPANGPTTPGW